jgi:hypothetical protein
VKPSVGGRGVGCLYYRILVLTFIYMAGLCSFVTIGGICKSWFYI